MPAGVAIPAGLTDRNIVTWVCYTYPFNLTGQPAASIPAGLTAKGLPVGLQIVARDGREEDILCAAAALEAIRPFSTIKGETHGTQASFRLPS